MKKILSLLSLVLLLICATMLCACDDTDAPNTQDPSIPQTTTPPSNETSNSTSTPSTEGGADLKPTEGLEYIILEPEGYSFAYIAGIGTADAKNIVVADTYEGKPVIGVYPGAFYESGITSITLPEGITSILEGAFYDCGDLIDVRLPSTLVYLDEEAFYGCSKLEGVSLPAKLETIGDDCFKDCTSLKNLTIPVGTTEIGGGFLDGCTALTSLNVAQGNTTFTVNNGCLIKVTDKTLLYAFESVDEIPADGSVEIIGKGIFNNRTDLTEIVIPTGIKQIKAAFRGCQNLTKLTLPASLEKIDSYAFDNCTALTGVYISDLAAWCGIDFENNANPLRYANNLYLNNLPLIELTIPQNVTTVKANAFRGCHSLSSITIPAHVTTLCENAFADCRNVTTLNFNATDMVSCTGTPFSYLGCDVAKTTIYIGANVTQIPSNLFGGSIMSLGSYQPQGFHLDELIFAEGSNCKEIGEDAFLALALTELSLPEGIVTIKEGGLGGAMLIKLTLPSTLTTIETAIFSCKEALYLVQVTALSQAGVEHLEEWVECGQTHELCEIRTSTSTAFAATYSVDANGLVTLTYPDGKKYLITYIGNSSELDLTGMGITDIGEYSFYENEIINSIVISNENPVRIGEAAFLGSSLTRVVFTNYERLSDNLKDPEAAADYLTTSWYYTVVV